MTVPRIAYLSVDVEGDCPPYLDTWRGIEEGIPRLLGMFAEERAPATFFTTGEVARRFPGRVADIVAGGHELGSHGLTHRAFRDMDAAEAEHEINESAAILRAFAPVTSFRAPYLSFPERYVPLLGQAGFTLDASRAAYKRQEPPYAGPAAPARLSTSVTSSVLRLPRLIPGSAGSPRRCRCSSIPGNSSISAAATSASTAVSAPAISRWKRCARRSAGLPRGGLSSGWRASTRGWAGGVGGRQIRSPICRFQGVGRQKAESRLRGDAGVIFHLREPDSS